MTAATAPASPEWFQPVPQKPGLAEKEGFALGSGRIQTPPVKTPAVLQLSRRQGEAKMKETLTTCGYCGCGCNFYLTTEGDRIVGVRPKPDHPVSRGMLCAKGWQGHGFVRHPDRLTSPLLREDRGAPLREAGWDEAYAFIRERLGRALAEHGPDSFALLSSARCTNEENYLAARFARAVIGSPHIDHCARL